jgi:NADH-quinone oxidoreductase subunit J
MAVAFAILAAWLLVTGVGVVAARRPIYNALFLVANMLGLAVTFLVLNAQFLFAAQIIVYAGAVMVLFVFIIALLNPEIDVTVGRSRGELVLGALFGAVFAGLLIVLLANRDLGGRRGPYTAEAINHAGNVQTTGTALYTIFLLPVEVTSLLLLVAAVGAVYLAMRRQALPLKGEGEARR